MNESPADLRSFIAAVERIEFIPTLLKMLCHSTGMRFAAVACVSERNWTACALHDDIDFGLKAGDPLPIHATLCDESRAAGAPMFMEHASIDPKYRSHPAHRVYKLESYVTVPILLADGTYFGNLCAFDSAPAPGALQRNISVFEHCADLIGSQLSAQVARDKEHADRVKERRSSELRERFIAILGHDLRNPLQAVLAMSEFLQKKLANPSYAELASRIQTNARRMSALIDDVHDVAHARSSGGVGVELKDVEDLSASLNAVVEELQDAQPDRCIVSNIRVTRTVRCDIGRVQQVASNLLANALTHGELRTPVRITAEERADGLFIEVWNAGEPIASESMDKIFEPFWSHSVPGGRQGLGLGLHICAHIVRAHHGRISVTSSRAEGTRFTVRLPLQSKIRERSLAKQPAPKDHPSRSHWQSLF